MGDYFGGDLSCVVYPTYAKAWSKIVIELPHQQIFSCEIKKENGLDHSLFYGLQNIILLTHKSYSIFKNQQ